MCQPTEFVQQDVTATSDRVCLPCEGGEILQTARYCLCTVSARRRAAYIVQPPPLYRTNHDNDQLEGVHGHHRLRAWNARLCPARGRGPRMCAMRCHELPG